MASSSGPPVLVEVDSLEVHFPILGGVLRRPRGVIRAVDGVSLAIRQGETLGIVGESGCGKSTLGRAVIGLRKVTKGTVAYHGEDLFTMSPRSLRRLRRKVQIVFQDPYGSLNPRMRVRDIVGEPITIHGLASGAAKVARVRELLDTVGLKGDLLDRYPHEFSGGQRQRIGIARALAVDPEFIVCDEPVSALDVSIQAQVLNLLVSLRQQFGLTYLFIAHNLSIVRHMSDRVAVMYLGRIVEVGNPRSLYQTPKHPYTVALLSAVPVPDPKTERQRKRIVLRGDVPSPAAPPAGCRFHPRCWLYESLGRPEQCRAEDPPLRPVAGDEHQAACHYAEEITTSALGAPSDTPRDAVAAGADKERMPAASFPGNSRKQEQHEVS